tara:strand:+ start:280 stop:993 length:714 start_codon:yes stop_codon:yes gene_type:complete
MSILSEQMFGSGNTPSTAINPFPKAAEWEGTPSVGFGGYTYAPEGLAELFNADETRTSPQAGEENNLGTGTEYGPVGRRIGVSEKTLLGQMADMLSSHADDPTWNTDGGGKKMAHTFTNSQQLKSLRNHQIGPGMSAEASGGPAVGYDSNNTYGVSNWDVAGMVVTTQQHKAHDIATTTRAFEARGKNKSTGHETWEVDLAAWIASGITTDTPAEAFRPTTDITTGLRNPLFADPQS